MRFVKNFTPPDFQAKNFTPLISTNFNSFGEKPHYMEKGFYSAFHWAPIFQSRICCDQPWYLICQTGPAPFTLIKLAVLAHCAMGWELFSSPGAPRNAMIYLIFIFWYYVAPDIAIFLDFALNMTCHRWKSTVLPGKLFFSKKNASKQAFFEDTIPGSPDFGRSYMPNSWD